MNRREFLGVASAFGAAGAAGGTAAAVRTVEKGRDRAGDVHPQVEVVFPSVTSATADDRSPVRCLFAKRALSAKRLLRFVVTPYNCWMKPGESIATNWKVYT